MSDGDIDDILGEPVGKKVSRECVECCGPAKSLNVNYELLDYKYPNTFMDATPGGKGETINRLSPTPLRLGGSRVAGLEPQPLPPAPKSQSKPWKPKGRR